MAPHSATSRASDEIADREVLPSGARPVRVLQVVLSLHPGGTERLVLDLVGRVHESMPMAVCCLDDEGSWARHCRERGVHVEALHRRSGFVPSLGVAVARAAQRHGATVIHAHQYSPFVYSALARVSDPRLRIVYTEHGRLSDAPPSPKRRAANAVLRRLPHRVFAVSHDLRRHMLQEGFRDDDVQVIHNGIPLGDLPTWWDRATIRRRLRVDDDACVVATVARLDPVKDLVTLIRAVGAIRDDRYVLVIIGDGPERQALEREADASGIGDRIRFVGQRHDARDWLCGADLYVNCSISEGISLTILEAMAAGRVVIATRVGGTPEILDDTCGVLIDARDPRALSHELVRLGRDAGLRQALGTAARRRVETRFTIERMTRQYLDAYLGFAQ